MDNNVYWNAGSADENGNGRSGAYNNGRVPPRVERGRRGRGSFEVMRGVAHVTVRARNHVAAGAPADVVFPGVPQLGAPAGAFHVGPPFQGGQLYDSADNGPRFMLHPDVVNAVVREPHVRAGQRGRGAQPRHQGAGLPPHMVRLPHVDADQEGMGIREVISEMMEHLFEVQNRYLNLHAMLMADGERVPANAVIEPYAFHLVNNAEGLEQRDVEHYRAYLSETYARFAREDDMLNAFLRAIFDMHARVLFLLDVHIDARI